MSSIASSTSDGGSNGKLKPQAGVPAEPLYQIKLLSALRSGDPALIHPLIAELGREKQRRPDDNVDLCAAALHLAIRCASLETVSLLLAQRFISPNAIHPPGSGTTGLHLAASIGRADIVQLLLEQEGIDDTLRDANGRTCKEVARGKDVLNAIRDSRTFLTASYRSLLHSYISSPPQAPPPQPLISLLSSPRVRLIDLSYIEESSGRTILHEAARRKDLRLIELCIRAGADVFVRDRQGRAVGDGIGGGKDDKVRVFLRQFTNQDVTLIDDASSNEPPTLKGYLSKYTNVAKGYNTRWFVLKDGVLSYYRYREDESVASRGSIAMKTAILKQSNTDKLRFEVHSLPTRAGSTSGIQKWYIRANHAAEVNRWCQALAKSIELYRKDTATESETDTRSVRSSVSSLWRSSANLSVPLPHKRASKMGGKLTPDSSVEGPTSDNTTVHRSPSLNDGSPILPYLARTAAGDTEVEGDDDDSGEDNLSQRPHPPHDASFGLHGNSTVAQVELTAQLLAGFPIPSNPSPQVLELRKALTDSVSSLQKMVSDYVNMVREREDWWKQKLDRERERGALWEESLQVVVREGESLENELKNRTRRRSRMFSTDGGGGSTIGRRTSARYSTLVSGSGMKIALPETFASPPGTPAKAETATITAVTPTRPTLLAPPAEAEATGTMPAVVASPPPTALLDDGESVVDTDEEDEFFDAIESNNLPNVIVPDALSSTHSVETLPPYVAPDQYVGYKSLRTRLPIDSDNRPPTSLWSVLKHSIGKDLTKISFPVFFNEPTSMLQRMAEDMEFSECLDAAASEADPLKRIAFVAAFAMSNYSSTIGRIAKPFNPMLSETFEYVRLDKRYRYVSEQVSHHPPISACWAESPMWHYYGEVDAQNKFMGKSFEIRPTGVAHTDLLIPEKLAPHYPKATGANGDGKVMEHYTWKKVTTCVSGFILGSPTIDHYGDMKITNHRTGDTCILTFKPRGWRGKDAFEIYGRVMDSSGTVVYEIAGRWNSQLVARAVGTGFGVLHPDVSVPSLPSPSASTEYILLWRNTEKPPSPFNLTPFAITLNDCPDDTLRPYICPTDCRLRPDQRAFEIGKYERANELKTKQEDYQRATRRAREDGRLPAHQPRWFEESTDKDSGERVWEPVRVKEGMLEYWQQREDVFRDRCEWAGIERIFIEDEP